MSNLSPQAQAVVDAFDAAAFQQTFKLNAGLSAALRAAVAQCAHVDDYGERYLIADQVLALAAELEGTENRAPSEYPVAGRDPCDCKGIAGDNGVCDDMCRRAGLR